MGHPGRQDPAIARTLAEGARRSRQAQAPGSPVPAPAPGVSPAPVAGAPTPARAFLVRHKWKIVGLLFLLLTELCLLFLGKGLVMGPG